MSAAGFGDVEIAEFGYVSLPKRLSKVESVAFRAATLVVPAARVRRIAATLDRRLAQRLPGFGGGMAVSGYRPADG